jgi:hypothetical protein
MIKHLKNIIFLLILLPACELADEVLNDAPPNVRLEGNWNCVENSSVFGESAYEVVIEADTISEQNIIFYNFYGESSPGGIQGTVQGNIINIPSQTKGEDRVRGNGSVNNAYNDMELSYIVDLGVRVDSVQAFLTKQ